ncbi:MAG TPA: hypothetical protein PLD86_05680, partial [Vicinamibacteria bacterium]|nr:hypothetical protein [Vicinamibacteria bacterium]
MNRAKCSKGRGVGLAVCGLLAAFLAATSASAQPVDSTGSSALDPAIPALSGLEREFSRAEALFRQGEDALGEGREADARNAFDAALDVFVSVKAQAAADPRFLAAYQGLVDRITAAEIAAGGARNTFSPLPPKTDPAPSAPNLPIEPPAASTLAELGARIETLTPTEEDRKTNEAVLGREEIDLPIEL